MVENCRQKIERSVSFTFWNLSRKVGWFIEAFVAAFLVALAGATF
jgi:hypothetical protein